MTGKHRKRRPYPAAEDRAIALHLERPSRSAEDIHRALVDEMPSDQVPATARTVRNWLAEYVRDESEPWTLADDPTGELGALVLPVITHLHAQDPGRLFYLTRNEADWVARVRRASPDMEPNRAFGFAVQYLRAVDTGDPANVAAVDIQLATGWSLPAVTRRRTWEAIERRLEEPSK